MLWTVFDLRIFNSLYNCQKLKTMYRKCFNFETLFLISLYLKYEFLKINVFLHRACFYSPDSLALNVYNIYINKHIKII